VRVTSAAGNKKIFIGESVCRVLHTDSPMKLDQTVFSENLPFKLQMLGNNPKENI
jgi:hypothetical protein